MKILNIIITFMLSFCLLSGCSTADKPSAEEVAYELKALTSNSINWSELDNNKMSTYFQLENSEVENFKGYINSAEERFDMIAVFSFSDQKAKKSVLEAVEATTRDMSENYKLANGNEATKISNRLLAETDDLVILCIIDQNDSLKKYLTDNIGVKLL